MVAYRAFVEKVRPVAGHLNGAVLDGKCAGAIGGEFPTVEVFAVKNRRPAFLFFLGGRSVLGAAHKKQGGDE